MKKYALIGINLSHSYSPQVHSLIFKELGIEAKYELLECKSEQLKDVIDLIRKDIYSGYNVTSPHKLLVMKYLDEIDPNALRVGSVNTVAKINGKIVGYNSDYYGFKNSFKYYNIDPNGMDCYILGTGGASLAASCAIKDLGGNVFFVSRKKRGNNIISYEELKKRKIDILVNCTPVGMYPDISSSPCDYETVKRAKYVMDMIFNPTITKILEYGNSNMNGLFMLVSQAIVSEEIWQNRKIDLSEKKIMEELKL